MISMRSKEAKYFFCRAALSTRLIDQTIAWEVTGEPSAKTASLRSQNLIFFVPSSSSYFSANQGMSFPVPVSRERRVS